MQLLKEIRKEINEIREALVKENEMRQQLAKKTNETREELAKETTERVSNFLGSQVEG